MRLILWVLRNSYGYRRKNTKPASIRKIGEETKMSISSVHLALQVLLENGILIKNSEGGFDFDKNKIADFVQPTEHPVHQKAFSPLNESVQPTEHPVQPTERILQPTERPLIIERKLKESLIKERERKVFAPPSLEEIKKYCIERKNHVNPEKWLAHYESNGWIVGKTKMRDWKASVRYWEHSDFAEQKKSNTGCPPVPGKYDGIGSKA